MGESRGDHRLTRGGLGTLSGVMCCAVLAGEVATCMHPWELGMSLQPGRMLMWASHLHLGNEQGWSGQLDSVWFEVWMSLLSPD